MLQTSEHLGFLFEAPQNFRVTVSASQHLDRDGTARSILLRRVDDAHAAGAERPQHEKAPETRARLEWPVERGHVERGNLLRIEKAVVRRVERRQEGLDFVPERVVVAAAGVEN